MRPALALVLLAACSRATPESASSEARFESCPEGTLSVGGACTSFLQQECALPPVPAASDIALTADQVYTTPYRGETFAAPQALDIARPRVPATKAPVALLVHGGGWVGGSKSDHRADILRLAGMGWVGISVDYRLVEERWKNRFPGAISDVRCAVRWVRAHADELGADPGRIVAIGASAGGNLAELLGTSSDGGALDDGQCETTGTAAVRAVVSYYGRADFAVPPLPDYLVDYIGRDGDWRAREALGSPLRHVNASTAPTLLVHGQGDGTVPVAQSRTMRDALRSAGVPVGIMELPGQGHGFPVFGTDGTQRWGACSTLAFLDLVTR